MAAWQPGDPPGSRRFATVHADEPLTLEAGGSLRAIDVAYETWGRLDADRSNAVLVLHALTGDSHAAGPSGPGHPQPGWWEGVIGPGLGIDTDRWYVVCPNVLGGCQGTTGPATRRSDGRRYGAAFPRITIRDQVAVEAALADVLRIDRWAAVIGGSMGGMRAVEWIVAYPDRVARAVVLATGAAATAEQIALCSIQNQAIRLDPAWAAGEYYDRGAGPVAGLGLARRLGHVSYRTELELDARFGRQGQAGEADPRQGGRFAVESYLDHHAEKLSTRFDANSYLVLSEAMNHHDVGRGRSGVAAALGRVTAAVTVVGIDSDRLYPLRLQQEMAELLGGQAEFTVVSSDHGHDGFLIETPQVAKVIGEALTSGG